MRRREGADSGWLSRDAAGYSRPSLACALLTHVFMKLSEFLFDLGKPVAFYPGLVKYLGSVNATLFFCQLFYWKDRAAHSDLGVYKTQAEIQEETGMTRYEQESARKLLCQRGVLIETHKRLEHRIYFKIDVDRLNEILLEGPPNTDSTTSKPTPSKALPRMRKNHIRECDKTTSGSAENQQPPNVENQHSGAGEIRSRLYTENTSQITAENTYKGGASAPDSIEFPTGRNKSVDFLTAKGVDHQVAVDWMVARKSKAVTPTVWSLIVEEATKAGISPVEAVTWSCKRGYANFMAEWYQPEAAPAGVPAVGAPMRSGKKPTVLEANLAAMDEYLAQRAARMGNQQPRDMGEVEQVYPQQSDFFGGDGFSV